jgi:hypothetical protein
VEDSGSDCNCRDPGGGGLDIVEISKYWIVIPNGLSAAPNLFRILSVTRYE